MRPVTLAAGPACGCSCASSASAPSAATPPPSIPFLVPARPARPATRTARSAPARHRGRPAPPCAGPHRGVSAPPSAELSVSESARLADTAPTLDPATAAAIAELRAAAGAVPDRGVYGTKAPAKDRILAAVAAAEACVAAGPPPAATAGGLPPSPLYAPDGAWAPTAALPALAGDWAVLWSTVTCTGSRRVKLGLKTAVSLGGVTQAIQPSSSSAEGATPGGGGTGGGTATNTVSFAMHFMGGAAGALTLEAAYTPLSPVRVGISLTRAGLAPPALDALFGPARLPLLLEIFNPEGWLDTTFVGGGLRVGRDDKGHVYVLERVVGAGGSGGGGEGGPTAA
jgi:hypothetical protein